LELAGLTRRYGALTALDGLSFSVPAGQVVGFLGPNGAGKTTTMRAIFGLTELDSGTVIWKGFQLGQAERRRFGYMPEERGLYPAMHVAEQVEYLGRLHGMTAHDAEAATKTWLERLGVADRADSKVDALSHGNQQRVQLAARSALRSGSLDLAIVNGRELLVNKTIGPNDTTTTAQLVLTIAQNLGVVEAMEAAKLSATQASVLAHAKPLRVTSLQPGKPKGATQTTSVVGLILVFLMLSQYNTWILIGVMEEKASRVVEVLLAAVRPVKLLAGKVLGIGLVAFAQAALIVAFALVLASSVGSDLLKGTAPLVLISTLLWLVLGYGFYCWVYAAAGSMASRQDQV